MRRDYICQMLNAQDMSYIIAVPLRHNEFEGSRPSKYGVYFIDMKCILLFSMYFIDDAKIERKKSIPASI